MNESSRPKLYVATHNAHKIREIGEILSDYDIVADNPAGVEETADTFAGNALIKVRAIAARHKGAWCLADDSGLEVAALGGAPGVHSARYAGEACDTAANNALLMKNLAGQANRSAAFVSAVALVDPRGREHVVVGRCLGKIAEKASGKGGFGYDPLFIPEGYDKTFADLTEEEKNAISHRGRALAAAKSVLEKAETPRKGGRWVAWMRFFRIVNLPTVPGDLLVGAALALVACKGGAAVYSGAALFAAIVGSCALYLYGLADNDIVGAATDTDRPIPRGEISLGAARLARAFCWGGLLLAGVLGKLPLAWWIAAGALLLAILAYNRTKSALLMGICRGINVFAGAAAIGFFTPRPPTELELAGWDCACTAQIWSFGRLAPVAGAALLWTLFIAAVTRYSAGEETDPAKKRRVGLLIGGLVYLQLTVLLGVTLLYPSVTVLQTFLIAGALLLLVLRLLKRVLPRVEAS